MAGGVRVENVGVMGHPIGHSLSPVLHEAAFAEMGLPWTSERFDVDRGHGAEAVAAMKLLGIRGLSVTMPLKAEAAAAADRLEPSAQLLDSVNTLSLEDGIVVGLSTDGDGLLAAIRHETGFSASGSSVAVIGSGGAARSIVSALGVAGASSIVVIARNPEAATSVATLGGDGARPGDPREATSVDLVIQTTPVGMQGAGHEDAPNLVDPGLLHAGQIAVDIVYRPLKTRWLEDAERRGVRVLGGLGMLVHQAALAVERWTSMEAPVEAMWMAASRALEEGPW